MEFTYNNLYAYVKAVKRCQTARVVPVFQSDFAFAGDARHVMSYIFLELTDRRYMRIQPCERTQPIGKPVEIMVRKHIGDRCVMELPAAVHTPQAETAEVVV